MNLGGPPNRVLGVFGLVLVVASILALALSVYSSIRSTAYARCQSAVSEALIRSSTARADAAAEDRESDRDETTAVTKLINDVFAATSREQSRAAYEEFRATEQRITARRAATEQKRRANPLPQPPSEVCR